MNLQPSCKFKCGHIIYEFGVLFCKDCNEDVPMMCCATHETRCDQLVQGHSDLLPAAVSTSVHLKLLFILFFHSCSMSSSILLLQVSPSILSYAKWLASISCRTFLSVKFTDTTSPPEPLFYFYVVKFLLLL